MKLFEALIFHGDSFTVKCPDCGCVFIEDDTPEAIAVCPNCPARGYINTRSNTEPNSNKIV